MSDSSTAIPERDGGAVIDWRAAGAKAMRRVRGGRSAWRLRAPRTSPKDWVIEAKHCPYLGQHPYNHGDDAWRISIQHHDFDRDCWIEVGHSVAASEGEAFEHVAYIAALAAQRDSGSRERHLNPSVNGSPSAGGE